MCGKLVTLFLIHTIFLATTSSCLGFRKPSPGEQSAQRQETIALKFRAMDTNRDGKVTREEFRGRPDQFDRLDADGDGAITMEELEGRGLSRQQAPPPAPKGIAHANAKPRTAPLKVDFGLCTTPREFQTDQANVKELGIVAVRFPVPWQFIEPREGQFDWQKADSYIKSLRSMGLQVLLNVRSVSSWGTTQETKKTGGYHSSSMPRDLRQWERFLGSMARRYKGMGVHYEIENEVSAKAFWTGSKSDYLELLKRSYAAIKEADPKALVLCAAMPCGITQNFSGPSHPQFKALHDDWLLSYLPSKAFDAVSVHNYYFPSGRVVNGFTFRSYQEHILNLMKQAGVPDKPVWNTEAGYVSRTTTVRGRTDDSSLQQQAQWIEEAVYQASELDVKRIFWILLRDREESYFGAMGLADAKGNPRPAWSKVQNLSSSK